MVCIVNWHHSIENQQLGLYVTIIFSLCLVLIYKSERKLLCRPLDTKTMLLFYLCAVGELHLTHIILFLCSNTWSTWKCHLNYGSVPVSREVLTPVSVLPSPRREFRQLTDSKFRGFLLMYAQYISGGCYQHSLLPCLAATTHVCKSRHFLLNYAQNVYQVTWSC